MQEVAGDNLRLVEAGAETDLQRLTASFHLNLTAFGLLSFLVGLFIVHSATGLAFEQRLPMLRTLRACGVSPRELVAMLVAELVLLALLAGAGGVVVRLSDRIGAAAGRGGKPARALRRKRPGRARRRAAVVACRRWR